MQTRNIATRRASIAVRPRASTRSRTTQGARSGKGRASRVTPRIAKDDAEAEESAAKDVPARATRRRKISADVSVDTPPAQPISVPRGTRRRSEPSGRVAVTVQPKPKSRSRTIARRRSVAVCDEPAKADKGEEKALQEDKRSLKRDRQAFEQESQRERAELSETENKVRKLDSQLQRKLAALKKQELSTKKRETECKKREQTLKKRDAECAAHEANIVEREKVLQKKEQEMTDRALGMCVTTSNFAIDELDVKWQCALCYDVMACPYSLSPAQCGHTYCAICILKWYFTGFCVECGDWCQSLSCPLCRTVIPRFTARPRQMYMLPFTPARAADEQITQLINILRGPVLKGTSKSSDRKRGEGKKKEAAGAGGSDAEPLLFSTGWEHDGPLRAEWQARNSRGRTEMQKLIDSWPQITYSVLRAYKIRICGN